MSYLVRYGAISEVARCAAAGTAMPVRRGADVVIETHRGLQLGQVLQNERAALKSDPEPTSDSAFNVVREATEFDRQRHQELRREANEEFALELAHPDWNVDVQLIDLEWTLDRSKLVLYVLNDRGPECTKLAIQAAAAGLGVVEVQPVSREGLVSQPPSGGGCGSCGCDH